MIDTVEPPNDEYQGTNDSHLLLGHPPEFSDSVKLYSLMPRHMDLKLIRP